MNEVFVYWESQSSHWWNETCALIIEQFGLPGERYTSHPEEEKMTFKFFNEHDALLCKILISDKL